MKRLVLCAIALTGCSVTKVYPSTTAPLILREYKVWPIPPDACGEACYFIEDNDEMSDA